MIKKFKMINLECAHCAAKMEREIKKLDGVNDASVNFILQRMTVDFKEEDFSAVVGNIEKVCKKIEPDCVVKV